MNSLRSFKVMFVVAVMAVVFVAPADVHADERCCLNNYRYAGGCMVVARGQETCQGVLSYLNSFQSVGKYYCDNTTVRGGWSLTDCGDPAQLPNQNVTPQLAQPSAPAQQAQPSMRPVQPRTAPSAQDATLIQTSAPLAVRFDTGVDSTSQDAGQVVTGTLEEDLMSGDTVIAPAGSEVHARLVPTSYWTDGGGDAFEIQATAVKVGDQMVPLTGTATQAHGAIPTSGSEVKIPKGTMVSFETAPAAAPADGTPTLKSGTARWMETFNAEDADGLASLYADNAVLLPPNAPAVFGRDAIRATNKEFFASGDFKIEIEDLETVINGDLAYVAGRYRIWTDDGTLVDRGKYVEIWRAFEGEWLIHRDIYNSSLSLPDTQEDDK